MKAFDNIKNIHDVSTEEQNGNQGVIVKRRHEGTEAEENNSNDHVYNGVTNMELDGYVPQGETDNQEKNRSDQLNVQYTADYNGDAASFQLHVITHVPHRHHEEQRHKYQHRDYSRHGDSQKEASHSLASRMVF